MTDQHTGGVGRTFSVRKLVYIYTSSVGFAFAAGATYDTNGWPFAALAATPVVVCLMISAVWAYHGGEIAHA